MNYFELLNEMGINPIVPYATWPGNLLSFCETAVEFKCTPVKVICPNESRDLFYCADLFSEKPKFTVLKKKCMVMDGMFWKPCIVEPFYYKTGVDCIYRVITEKDNLTYTPSDDLEFRHLVGYPKKTKLYGFIVP